MRTVTARAVRRDNAWRVTCSEVPRLDLSVKRLADVPEQVAAEVERLEGTSASKVDVKVRV